MDTAAADLAAEAAGMLVRMIFPGCGVKQSAIGAAKLFDGPDGACHPANMRFQMARSSCFRLYN
jgi:hypothetical protein